jgi:hypothetical protein
MHSRSFVACAAGAITNAILWAQNRMIAEGIPVLNVIMALIVCIAAMIHSECPDTGLIALLAFHSA